MILLRDIEGAIVFGLLYIISHMLQNESHVLQ